MWKVRVNTRMQSRIVQMESYEPELNHMQPLNKMTEYQPDSLTQICTRTDTAMQPHTHAHTHTHTHTHTQVTSTIQTHRQCVMAQGEGSRVQRSEFVRLQCVCVCVCVCVLFQAQRLGNTVLSWYLG